MGAEDFHFIKKKFRAILFFRGALKASQYLKQLRIIPRFYIDESGFVLGMKPCQTYGRLHGNDQNKK
jgi:hypothetical protein